MHFQFRKVASAEGPLVLQESLDVSKMVKGRKDILSISPLTANLRVIYAGEGMANVEGTLTAEFNVSCSRCLTPVNQKIDIDFKERFVHGQEPEEEEDMEDDVNYVPDENVDLAPYLEESLMLNLPMAALCSADCKGLCPVCGVNRNEQECSCDTSAVDPRLAALKDFFK